MTMRPLFWLLFALALFLLRYYEYLAVVIVWMST